MDEITAKRVERDLQEFKEAGATAIAGFAQATEQIGERLTALKVEYEKRVPAWAGDLLTMPTTMLTFCMSRLHVLGAPPEYLMRLLRAVIGEAPPTWPQPATDRPDWVREPGDLAQCECGAEHPGGARDLASQVVRLLMFLYEEMVEVIATEMVFQREIPDITDDETEIRERTLEVLTFQMEMFAGFMPSV